MLVCRSTVHQKIFNSTWNIRSLCISTITTSVYIYSYKIYKYIVLVYIFLEIKQTQEMLDIWKKKEVLPNSEDLQTSNKYTIAVNVYLIIVYR